MPARLANAERRRPVAVPRCTEPQLSRAVVELAELLGWGVYTIRRSDRAIVASETGIGFPDLVMAKPGRLLAAELKQDRRYPTPAQRAWLSVLATVPGVESFVWRPADWRNGSIERALRAGT